MRILIAPAPFKGFMTSEEAILQIAEGVHSVIPSAEILSVPMSSGGAGFALSIARAHDADIKFITSEDALGRPVQAPYVDTGKVVALEAGPLLRVGARDFGRIFMASSRGLGLAILQIKNMFPDRELMVGIGDAEVMDGGKGAAEVFGARFINMDGSEVSQGASGLIHLAHITYDRAKRLGGVSVVCDYMDPLSSLYELVRTRYPTTAKREALQVYLSNFIRVLKRVTGVKVDRLQGGATAYGMPALFHTLFGWGIVFGAPYIADQFDMDYKLLVADLVLTGEGRLDDISFRGKAVGEVVRKAQRLSRQTIILSGESRISNTEIPEHTTIVEIDAFHDNAPESAEESRSRLLNATAMVLREYMNG